ncbi:MAG TPA: hypothetical protein VMT69_01440 [Kineosporiaceae bacterium]|nr:hypothetical protein [Kineosporiaceae bacterium]
MGTSAQASRCSRTIAAARDLCDSHGRDGGTCTITSVDLTADPPLQVACNATFELPGGTIATQGLATNAPVKHLVITGGTGAYLGAAGEATLTEFGNDTGTIVFHLAR